MPVWPPTREELIQEQSRLGALEPTTWRSELDAKVGGVSLCFARGESGPGGAGDAAWTGACVGRHTTVVLGQAGAPYEPGLLALSERAHSWKPPYERYRNCPMCFSSTRPAATIRAGLASRSSWARCSGSRL